MPIKPQHGALHHDGTHGTHHVLRTEEKQPDSSAEHRLCKARQPCLAKCHSQSACTDLAKPRFLDLIRSRAFSPAFAPARLKAA